ncbi:conserved hypothetical protein [Methylocella silvestris BL2]|uniref:VWFA domain-containing protein n=1 Tax=Methylocella silvestris (strain DSM 15510 / CIP 108128 / LMG 27833 / NCIMB 13906 / BL2) TaxID=395965 RepID=B8EI10_METSB|nr:hypothetical protein [Methylocella silvestris]ACK50492.1 conserved hypothetical protein [Methylocella silvestris BL2]
MARAARRRRSAHKSTSNALWAGVLIALPVLALAGFGFVYFTIQRGPVLDKMTLCPVNGPRSVSVLLIDASDDLPAAAKRELAKILNDEAEALAPYGLLDIRLLDPATARSHSIFARCNPGDGAGLSEWTANPALARKRWTTSFQQPVSEAIERSLGAAPSLLSPIMAAIQDIAIERFTGRAAETSTRRLIVISDMIENDPDYSQYNVDLSYARYKKSTAYQKFSTDLHAADVSIYYVQRLMKHPIDATALVRFWSDWIADNNGRLRSVTRLQGAA